MKNSILFLLALVVFNAAQAAAEKATDAVVVSQGKYSDYYHLRYVLKPQNTTYPSGTDKYGAERTLQMKDGMFEIFIKPEQFPIKAPVSAKHLILRMASNKDSGCTHIFQQIKEMLDTPQGQVPVIIELNPYVEKISDHPLQLKLTESNVFFRQSNGVCVNEVGTLPAAL
jgi:hypothetical protein